ncbi:MAG: NlpC/P60 family protein [Dehalococcoidales bacterium]|jgi:cell wall-associated NlpC family hydrolase|nr:NlpC/P60 family protein [Dehalococcoidales bacterium]
MKWTDLIGIPFVDGGRDPTTGLDCWGLFIVARRCFGFLTPDYAISCFATDLIDNAVAQAVLDQWYPIKTPYPGCGVAMRTDAGCPEAVQHFGVYVGNNRFLHTLAKTGAIQTRLDDRYFGRKIVGYYRYMHDHSGQ